MSEDSLPNLNLDEGQNESSSDSSGPQNRPELSTDLYDRIVNEVQAICQSILPETADQVERDETLCEACEPPRLPRSLSETGISLSQLCDLILKTVYLHGALSGDRLTQELRLPFCVTEEGISFLEQQGLLNADFVESDSPEQQRYSLSDSGRRRTRDAFEECRYVGPAPVSLRDYAEQCRKQSTRNIDFSEENLRDAFDHLHVHEDLFKQLGPAILSGQSMILFGPPGNGKSVLSKAIAKLMSRSGGTIYVPFAVTVDQRLITVFDPSVHRAVDHTQTESRQAAEEKSVAESENQQESDVDLRWRKILRPVIQCGSELTLEMLNLKYNELSGYYSAPIQMKANGGVMLIDDFGRQEMPSKTLFNRWILPLEERLDTLSLKTGKLLQIPFEQLTIFSTSQSPEEQGDQAFLRRVRHKIPVPPPTDEQFRSIFRRACEERHVRYDDWIVTQMLTNCYNSDHPPKSSDPRDLLDAVHAICRFNGESFHLSEELLTEAWRYCLNSSQGSTAGNPV
ncbi:ATP-binding protein [Thalassoglobus neptunius]|uniref:ATPase n=1 Tax=Thalassoglobus neptunius TaxID=1938619 RepID=UPI0011B425D1|nr:ATPase [Thalassoglobus neptunius]